MKDIEEKVNDRIKIMHSYFLESFKLVSERPLDYIVEKADERLKEIMISSMSFTKDCSPEYLSNFPKSNLEAVLENTVYCFIYEEASGKLFSISEKLS